MTTVLFVGQFYDHHGDRTFFIKHRPTFRQMFSLPSKGKNQLIKLSVAEQLEEDENQEFVSKGNLQESHGSIFIPAALIQICIMLFVSACFSFYKRTSLTHLQLIFQFFINILITFFGVFFMLWNDDSTTSFIWFAILILSNCLTVVFLDRLERRSKKSNEMIDAPMKLRSS